MTKNQLKLTIELAPGRLSGRQLRHRLLPNLKKKIERRVLERARYTCEVCGTKGIRPGEDVFQWDDKKEEILGTKKRVHWDEVWQYDDKKPIARLIRLQALCEDCRKVKHVGFILRQLSDREVESIGQHFCRVNKVGMLLFWHHAKQAEDQCERRNQHNWEVDYGEYESLVPKRKKRSKEDKSTSDAVA
jgi:hypothetical protein